LRGSAVLELLRDSAGWGNELGELGHGSRCRQVSLGHVLLVSGNDLLCLGRWSRRHHGVDAVHGSRTRAIVDAGVNLERRAIFVSRELPFVTAQQLQAHFVVHEEALSFLAGGHRE